MAADKISIKVEADTRDAQQNLRQFQGQANETAQAGQRIGQRFDGAGEKIKAFAASVARVGTAVIGVSTAFAAGAYKVAEFAAKVEEQEAAINRLGPAYDAVRVATNGVVSAQDALKAQQTLVQAGIRVSAEQLGTITRAAREYARATGTEVTGALEQLTDALRTGSGEGLGRFGVSLQQGVTGTRAFGSALEQLTAQQQGTAASARTMREDLDKLPEGLTALGRAALSAVEGPLDSLMRALTGVVGASTGLRGVLRELGEAGDTLRQRDRQQATDAAAMQRLDAQEQLFRTAGAAGVRVGREQLRGLSAEQVGQLQQRLARIGQVQSVAVGRLGQRGLLGLAGGGAFGALERQSQFEGALQEIQAQRQAEEALARLPQGGARPAATATRARGAGAARPAQQGPRSVDELFASLFGERTLEDAFSQAEGRLRGLISTTLGAVSDPAVFDEILAESATEQGPRQQGFAERVFRAAGIDLDAEGRTSAFDALQSGADMLGQSLGTLRDGFGQLFNTLASGSLSAGEAFQQFAAKTLSSLGEMAVQKGVFYTFEGIASIFTNPVAAPLYFAAGAGLIALGAGLGAAGSAVAPRAPAGGSAAPSAARSASGASPRDAGGGAGNVTIVLSSLVPPGPRELQGLVAAQRQAGRYGLDNGRMVPRQVRA